MTALPRVRLALLSLPLLSLLSAAVDAAPDVSGAPDWGDLVPDL